MDIPAGVLITMHGSEHHISNLSFTDCDFCQLIILFGSNTPHVSVFMHVSFGTMEMASMLTSNPEKNLQRPVDYLHAAGSVADCWCIANSSEPLSPSKTASTSSFAHRSWPYTNAMIPRH
jgi:hypothetical protein